MGTYIHRLLLQIVRWLPWRICQHVEEKGEKEGKEKIQIERARILRNLMAENGWTRDEEGEDRNHEREKTGKKKTGNGIKWKIDTETKPREYMNQD